MRRAKREHSKLVLCIIGGIQITTGSIFRSGARDGLPSTWGGRRELKRLGFWLFPTKSRLAWGKSQYSTPGSSAIQTSFGGHSCPKLVRRKDSYFTRIGLCVITYRRGTFTHRTSCRKEREVGGRKRRSFSATTIFTLTLSPRLRTWPYIHGPLPIGSQDSCLGRLRP